jgi:hypothetical protein
LPDGSVVPKNYAPSKDLCPASPGNRLPGFELGRLGCGECHIQHRPENATAKGWAKAESDVCVARLKYFNLAIHIWATNHNGTLPADFLSMTNELKSPKLLFCLADHDRRPLASWSEFDPEKVSYDIEPISEATNGPPIAYISCRIHGHQLLPDGTIVQVRK